MKLLLFGAGGQDGLWLDSQATAEGHQVVRVGPKDPHNPLQLEAVSALIRREVPDEIYYLAAYHRSSEEAPESDVVQWNQSFDVHVRGWIHVLDSAKQHAPRARLLYASSAHIFGEPAEVPQSEVTPRRPSCPYGCSKLAGMEVGEWFRKVHGLWVSHAILYPHESIHRSPAFLSKKLLLAAHASAENPSHCAKIGDPEAVVDWGYAPEYTKAMRKLLTLRDPEDFIISTGHAATVGDFAREIFAAFGLDWKKHIQIQASLLTKPKRTYVGNCQKLFQASGQRPTIHLPELAHRLVRDFQEAI